MRTPDHNPDVLSCLANLSSDEVFTPPELANKMLDILPQELFSDPNTKFLDPVCKTGVFLREIAKRLIAGLANTIPDRVERCNHIFTNQIYGIALTELTALISRRTVYCSKKANSKFSICDKFRTEEGNIIYKKMHHTWENNKCIYCGASQAQYDRPDDLETYAYNFLHTDNPQEFFNAMQFDVIIGNPPYQLNDGGGTGSSAIPIYHKFIEQAKKLNPKYLTMIIPARWYSGGKGLDDFRADMLSDRRIKKLIDFVDSRDCFPGVDIAGGICYFLWDRHNLSPCNVTSFSNKQATSSNRYLDEHEMFVRNNVAIGIIHKVQHSHDVFLDSVVSSRMPFGLASTIKPELDGDLDLITSSGNGKISSDKITQGRDLVSKWKVLLSKASNDHGGQPDKEGKRRIFSRIEVIPPQSVCTESYLVVGNYESRVEADNMANFLKTRFVRFLVSSILLTQNITKGKFIFVPLLNMTEPWTDEKLYAKYGLTEEEIAFIESMIRPMD